MDQPHQSAAATCLDSGKELPPLLRSWCNKYLWTRRMPAGYRNN